jgi:hypothetical protein
VVELLVVVVDESLGLRNYTWWWWWKFLGFEGVKEIENL